MLSIVLNDSIIHGKSTKLPEYLESSIFRFTIVY